jgi:hypothetical protein
VDLDEPAGVAPNGERLWSLPAETCPDCLALGDDLTCVGPNCKCLWLLCIKTVSVDVGLDDDLARVAPADDLYCAASVDGSACIAIARPCTCGSRGLPSPSDITLVFVSLRYDHGALRA